MMSGDGRLQVFCGKMASGKSTLAASIASEQRGIKLCEDEFLASLYPGEVVDVSTYVRFSNQIKLSLRSHIVELLNHGLVVVLDFPANTIDQRKWLLDIAEESGVPCTLHLLECTDEMCLSRLEKRVIDNPERNSTDTTAMFEAVSRYFQPPATAEGFDVILHKME